MSSSRCMPQRTKQPGSCMGRVAGLLVDSYQLAGLLMTVVIVPMSRCCALQVCGG